MHRDVAAIERLSRHEIERRRGRLLGYLALLLGAFASFSVGLSFLGPDFVGPLQVTPLSARVGILGLTVGFVALVLERERQLSRLSEIGERQRLLTEAFRNRLDVLESLLAAGDRLNAPLMVPDVMDVLLEAAIDLVGAEGGVVTAMAGEDDEDEIAVGRRHSVAVDPGSIPPGDKLEVDLVSSGRRIGTLILTRPFRHDDAMTESLLAQFTARAAAALDHSQLVEHERASVAYLRAANLVKSRFLQTVSHELRTPLTSIMGYALTLQRHWDRLDDRAKLECAHAIGDQSSKLKLLVERILDAARVELEGVTVRRVDHDVRRSIERALDRFEGQEDESRLETALPAEAVTAAVDPFVVEQTTLNLVDNALRYTTGPVRISLDGYKSTIVITVRDEGPGMDQNKLKLVTRPLYGLDEVKSGTGLGLHIVRTLIGDHGGTLKISSEESGTTVEVSLPRRAAKRKRQDALAGAR